MGGEKIYYVFIQLTFLWSLKICAGLSHFQSRTLGDEGLSWESQSCMFHHNVLDRSSRLEARDYRSYLPMQVPITNEIKLLWVFSVVY